MLLKLILYSLPAFPFVTRSCLGIYFRRQMMDVVPEEENDRETHRSLILALAGFSFSGLLALTIVDATVQINLQFSVWYLLVSFLCYFSALNLQGYKFCRWHDQFGDALMESASLSLMLAISAIVLTSNSRTPNAFLITIFSVGVWLIDHLIRVRLSFKYLQARRGIK